MSSNEPKILDKVLGVPLSDPDRTGFFLGSYKTSQDGVVTETALLYSPTLEQLEPVPLVRVNSACFTSDIFGDQRCDCRQQFGQAVEMLQRNGGLILYHFHHEGRGAGLTLKLRTTQRMLKENISTFEAMRRELSKQDLRQYRTAVAILTDLRILRLRLMTNNPEKIAALQSGGIEVVGSERVFSYRPQINDYINSKVEEQGHLLKDQLAQICLPSTSQRSRKGAP